MEIRPSRKQDFPSILDIYKDARSFMKNSGNPNQWGDSWPPENLIEEDIENKRSLVVTEGDEVIGVFVFLIGVDETYLKIDGGSWLNDEEYGVIHRIASKTSAHGVFDKAIEYCSKKVRNIRIDTHSDNKVMQHVIEKNGFTKCGTIYVRDGSPRIAYHKVIGD